MMKKFFAPSQRQQPLVLLHTDLFHYIALVKCTTNTANARTVQTCTGRKRSTVIIARRILRTDRTLGGKGHTLMFLCTLCPRCYIYPPALFLRLLSLPIVQNTTPSSNRSECAGPYV